MSRKIKIPEPIKAYGYVGVWWDGKVGWFAPKHIGGDKKYPDEPDIEKYHEILQGKRLFLCEITATPITDKLGRPITKIIK